MEPRIINAHNTIAPNGILIGSSLILFLESAQNSMDHAMTFPIKLDSIVNIDGENIQRTIFLYGGLTVLIGPNGSGKTHLMRGLKRPLEEHCPGKKVRFLSAGRMGLLEQYRSDYDGHRGGSPNYQQARYGSVDDTNRRHQYETLQGDFQTLAVRPDILIKVRERLRKLFGRDISVFWDAGSIKVEFVRTSGTKKSYPSGREASGLMHLAGLLAALYDDDVGALLIDEPEVSLHPQLQAFLLKEILGVAGLPSGASHKKLVVIGTHSTEFIRVETPADLAKLAFCYDLTTQPVQVSPDAEELKSSKIFSLISRMGQEHKLSFFAKSPLLVEGPSDAIICGGLANKFDLYLEAGGSQMLPVIGKGQFPIVVKLLRLVGKTPFVLADADALADGLDLANIFLMNPDANDRAAHMGFGSAIKASSEIYKDFSSMIATRWAEISSIAEEHSYWTNRDRDDADDIKAKRRASFSTLLSLSEDQLRQLNQDGKWLALKLQLEVLLNLLESQGCFVLRRGAIESYYQFRDQQVCADKPAAASEEVTALIGADPVAVENSYADVLRCLRLAAQTERIVEAESLQDILLAVAAPALARVKAGTTSSELLNLLARSTLGSYAGLFELEVKDGMLVIGLKSKILDVSGFPVSIEEDADVVKNISKALSLTSG